MRYPFTLSDVLTMVERVHTDRAVLASDASHFYANMENQRLFPIIYNTVDMLEGFKTCYRLAGSTEYVIPGHDPLVMARYPSPRLELDGWIARLDAPPKTMST